MSASEIANIPAAVTLSGTDLGASNEPALASREAMVLEIN
jgi:hypothetical protein